ncbi:unnamed protein product [Adineta ricciae]|uniref:RING-type E3 ubiquitin transferase n=1 Tax=Adineta ricciae TaxID=249248 RepID=A0A815HZ15_ADIRI|nr:unnamed protein product [Adineta ricciae]
MMIINLFLLYYLIQTTLSDVNVYNITNELLKIFDDQNARFGPPLPAAGLKGYITTTNPPNGCHKMDPPPVGIHKDGYQWIALISRTSGADSCEFVVKVENAQQANFSAVIIYNYEDTLLPMGSSSKAVHIPSTMITHTDGLLLISHYLYNRTTVNATPMYYVKLIPEPPFKLGIYMIPFIVVIAVSFLGLVGFILVRCHLERRRTRRHRLPRSALKQLKVKKFVKTDPWEVCIICLDEFEEGTKLRILPCDHAYHMKCIDRWLIDHRRQCPVCKRYVFPNHDHSDDEESGGRPQQRVSTEHTPLIISTATDAINNASNLHYFPHVRRMFNPLQSDVRGVSNVSSESSDSIENLSSSSRQTATTTEIIFNQPSINSRRYGSTDDSSRTAQRRAHRYFDISDETANDITTSMRSIVDDTNGIETTDEEDDQMHSVITSSEDNPSYVPTDDELARNTTNIHL